MNYMLLEGVGFYIFLVIILLLLVICAASLMAAILTDRKNYLLNNELQEEKGKTTELAKQNFKLKLLYGVLDINEK